MKEECWVPILRLMRRLALFLAFAGAGVATAVGAASPTTVVRVDGRIGALRIDVATEAQVRAIAGKPDRVEDEFFPPAKSPVGHTLYYRCGRGCETAYSINNATGKLSDFETSSPSFMTDRGSRVGMRASEAARREGKKFVPGCGTGPYLHLRWATHHVFVLTGWGGKVRQIIYLGPHTIYYDGLC
jgi:hypothetical protein